ncbi:MAG TPA: hypothetical protein P5307_23090, partial [Pirellulaceae bacterium]|nr:hypothetical protein [Pirellulaceae bacterium]
ISLAVGNGTFAKHVRRPSEAVDCLAAASEGRRTGSINVISERYNAAPCGQGFRFVQSAQFVRRLSEAVELSNSLLDGFGEPVYESLTN